MSSSTTKDGGIVGEKPLPPRKERSKSRDMGKRMGGGQKAKWNPTEIVPAVKAVDHHDPNYDSEDESNVILVSNSVPSSVGTAAAAAAAGVAPGNTTSSVPGAPGGLALRRKSSLAASNRVHLADNALWTKEMSIHAPEEIKKRFAEILDEFFSSGDVDEVASCIGELQVVDDYKFDLVKRAMTMAMDRHEKERELVSRLLSTLYLNGLTRNQLAMGFRRVLLMAQDLQLDIPNASSMLAIFCARAVVDEILPPSFLEDPFILRYAPEIAAEAIKKLSINHGSARMEKAWGPGDGRPVEELKVAIDQLTKEYLLSRDLDEAARCVRELHVPHFHHEVVKRGIVNALEDGRDANLSAMSSLLAYLVTQEIVSPEQLNKGFLRFKEVLPDVKLDIPSAVTSFASIVARAIDDGILNKDFDNSAV